MAGTVLMATVLIFVSAAHLSAQTPAPAVPPATTPAPAAPAPADAAPAPAPQGTSTLTIKVKGIRNAKGKLDVALYGSDKGFPLDPSGIVAAKQADIDPATMTVTVVFDKLAPGTYAATVMHDEKMVGKMEFDGNGIPQEGYGISNNPDTTQGPPTFDDAKVQVKDPGTAIEIAMIYWQ
jgi:uncharacterized protein (DUF2141 family)